MPAMEEYRDEVLDYPLSPELQEKLDAFARHYTDFQPDLDPKQEVKGQKFDLETFGRLHDAIKETNQYPLDDPEDRKEFAQLAAQLVCSQSLAGSTRYPNLNDQMEESLAGWLEKEKLLSQTQNRELVALKFAQGAAALQDPTRLLDRVPEPVDWLHRTSLGGELLSDLNQIRWQSSAAGPELDAAWEKLQELFPEGRDFQSPEHLEVRMNAMTLYYPQTAATIEQAQSWQDFKLVFDHQFPVDDPNEKARCAEDLAQAALSGLNPELRENPLLSGLAARTHQEVVSFLTHDPADDDYHGWDSPSRSFKMIHALNQTAALQGELSHNPDLTLDNSLIYRLTPNGPGGEHLMLLRAGQSFAPALERLGWDPATSLHYEPCHDGNDQPHLFFRGEGGRRGLESRVLQDLIESSIGDLHGAYFNRWNNYPEGERPAPPEAEEIISRFATEFIRQDNLSQAFLKALEDAPEGGWNELGDQSATLFTPKEMAAVWSQAQETLTSLQEQIKEQLADPERLPPALQDLLKVSQQELNGIAESDHYFSSNLKNRLANAFAELEEDEGPTRWNMNFQVLDNPNFQVLDDPNLEEIKFLLDAMENRFLNADQYEFHRISPEDSLRLSFQTLQQDLCRTTNKIDRARLLVALAGHTDI